MKIEDIQAIFFAECDEALGAAEQGLAACQAGTYDDDTVNAVFRAVHSIKGGAGAFGHAALQACTHGFETLLADVRDGALTITAPLLDLMLRALDTVGDHVGAARDHRPAPDDTALLAELATAMTSGLANPARRDGDFAAMLDDLAAALNPAAQAPGEPWIITVRPHAGAMTNGGEPLLMLRELIDLGGVCVACETGDVPPLGALDSGLGYLAWRFVMPGDVTEPMVSDIFDFAGDDCSVAFGDAQPLPPASLRPAPLPPVQMAPVRFPQPALEPPPAPRKPAAPAMAQSIRIELGKLDTLIDTVGELVIAQAMMAQRLAGLGTGVERAAAAALAQMEALTHDIQETAMAIRAQPIGTVFGRVPRILRELAVSTGKHVDLIVTGEHTELDNTVIERLGEPLTHLIRNAVDHGIEPADDRVADGKPAHGTLRLSAEQKAGRIVIRIADDGCGIDRERVLARAIERGVIAPGAVLSDDECNLLIFAPGFSTAGTITNVSGRGVGLDVVRRSVKDLGGRIGIETAPGSGTTFTLTLPLTLAISDGMVVDVGDQRLVVPLANVTQSLRPAAHHVKALGAQRAMIDVHGRFVPVVPLHLAIGATGAIMRPELGVLILVETETMGTAALLVDAICDQRQVVIKSLDTHFRPVDGVAGATILGDGRVALILDVDRLVTQHLLEAEMATAA